MMYIFFSVGTYDKNSLYGILRKTEGFQFLFFEMTVDDRSIPPISKGDCTAEFDFCLWSNKQNMRNAPVHVASCLEWALKF